MEVEERQPVANVRLDPMRKILTTMMARTMAKKGAVKLEQFLDEAVDVLPALLPHRLLKHRPAQLKEVAVEGPQLQHLPEEPKKDVVVDEEPRRPPTRRKMKENWSWTITNRNRKLRPRAEMVKSLIIFYLLLMFFSFLEHVSPPPAKQARRGPRAVSLLKCMKVSE